jgi:hypothetical protein
MASWNEFSAAEPQMAQQGRNLLYQVGVGLAYLATVRSDGGPRLHPICPLICAEGLFAFIVPSPKRADLHRDGRYALHSFPTDDNEDAFYVVGSARHEQRPELRAQLAEQFADERKALGIAPADDHELFVFDVASTMLTRTTGHGDPSPQHSVWRA